MKKLFGIVLFIFGLLTFGIPGISGEEGINHNSFSLVEESYGYKSAINNTYNRCDRSDCSSIRAKGSIFCTKHKCKITSCPAGARDNGLCLSHRNATVVTAGTCSVEGCNKTAKYGGKAFCSEHTCIIYRCAARRYKDSELCFYHYDLVYNTKFEDLFGGSYKHDKWPDVDDYEDLDDFLDDWDGYLPDGWDAEDYWIEFNG